MWNVPAEVRTVIENGTDFRCVIGVLRGGELVASDVEVISVTVESTITTADGRTARLQVDRGVVDAGLLDPLSDVVIVSYVSPVAVVPLFTGRVDSVADTDAGDVAVALMSRRQEVSRADFEVPFTVNAGATFLGEITRIIQNVDPSFGVDASQVSTTPAVLLNKTVPTGLTWETSRSQAVSDLADAAHVLWLPDRTGGFVLLPYRFTDDVAATATPVTVFSDGVNGTVVHVSGVRSRQDIVNSVTLVVERTDNSLPIRITVRDDVDGSPTRWGGAFGKQNRVIKINTPITAADALLLTQHILGASLALTRTRRIETITNPLIDSGDIIGVNYHGEVTAEVVESVSFSGDASSPTVLATRQLTVSTQNLV